MSLQTKKEDVAYKASLRKHRLLFFPDNYESVKKSLIRLQCIVCGFEWETKLHNYNCAKNGCLSCKKRKASCTHTNKSVTAKTRARISQKAILRSGSLTGKKGKDHPCWKNGYGRDKSKQSIQDYEWKNAVKKRFSYTCIVTGKKQNLHCHHLDGWNNYPEKRYDPWNGVLLHKTVHKMFHDQYKYGNNTELQFSHFLFHCFGLDYSQIQKDFEHGNHQPSFTLKKDRIDGSETREGVIPLSTSA